MVSAYYEQAVVKVDLGISGVGLDSQLDDWSDKIQTRIDDILFEVWSKRRNQISLPDLPLTGSDITQSIKDAANSGVKGKYYEVEQRDLDRVKYYFAEMEKYIQQFINRVKVTKRIHGRVIT